MRIENYSKSWISQVSSSEGLPQEWGRMLISSVEMENEIITFRARIHTLRRMSAKLVFIVFRQQTMTIQGVLQSFRPHSEGGRKSRTRTRRISHC
jgi:aspartyl/asparaginyl-tRNA synthetase